MIEESESLPMLKSPFPHRPSPCSCCALVGDDSIRRCVLVTNSECVLAFAMTIWWWQDENPVVFVHPTLQKFEMTSDVAPNAVPETSILSVVDAER